MVSYPPVMAKRMYEVLMGLDTSLSSADVDALMAKLKSLVDDVGGEVKGVEKLGIRKLAYKVRGKSECQFFSMTCEAPPAIVKQIEQVMRLHEGVVRSMTTRLDPSVLATSTPTVQSAPATSP